MQSSRLMIIILQAEMMEEKRGHTALTQCWKARRVEGKRTLLKKVSVYSENGPGWKEGREER